MWRRWESETSKFGIKRVFHSQETRSWRFERQPFFWASTQIDSKPLTSFNCVKITPEVINFSSDIGPDSKKCIPHRHSESGSLVEPENGNSLSKGISFFIMQINNANSFYYNFHCAQSNIHIYSYENEWYAEQWPLFSLCKSARGKTYEEAAAKST